MILHSEDKIVFIREHIHILRFLPTARRQAWSSAKYKGQMDEQKKNLCGKCHRVIQKRSHRNLGRNTLVPAKGMRGDRHPLWGRRKNQGVLYSYVGVTQGEEVIC